jgi:hypothetical protein
MTASSNSNEPFDILSFERSGHLTSSLSEARRVHETRGGYLFRMGDLYLICSHEEAMAWGWTPDELKALSSRTLVAKEGQR